LDLNLRLKLWTLDEARAYIRDFLPRVDIALPSDDEAAMLVGTSDPDAILDYFESFGAAHVALKRGAKGAVLSSSGRRIDIGARPVKAVDSTGAGDTFAGVFLAKLLATNHPETAARAAVEAAGRTVQHYGALR
ncbi:MAG: PfkB family carbohydrate kinase, partial [Tateyamaria sp.]